MFELKKFVFTDLINKKCHKLTKDTKALKHKEIEDVIEFMFLSFPAKKARWSLKKMENFDMLSGKFLFRTYAESFAFVSAIYLISTEQHYYPDITFGEGFVYVSLFTIKYKGITENDFIMLAKIESVIGTASQ